MIRRIRLAIDVNPATTNPYIHISENSPGFFVISTGEILLFTVYLQGN